jgi:hypothetical protein
VWFLVNWFVVCHIGAMPAARITAGSSLKVILSIEHAVSRAGITISGASSSDCKRVKIENALSHGIVERKT